jgi:hypothetical protein
MRVFMGLRLQFGVSNMRPVGGAFWRELTRSGFPETALTISWGRRGRL